MAFLIAQAGNALYKVDLTTGVGTQLTLPSGIVLSTTKRPRFALLNQWMVVTNSPNRNIVVDPEGNVRVLVPKAPDQPLTMAAGLGTGLTGAYQYKYSYVVLSADGNLLMESPLSPASTPVTLSNTNASITDLETSLDVVSARRIYRTTGNGNVLFQLMDIDGNVSSSFIENTPDLTLSLLPAQTTTLVSPPGTIAGTRLKNIIEWKSRLFGVADDPDLVDTVFACETNQIYAWPNRIVCYPTGEDLDGVIGFAKLKNSLGFLKRSGLWAISGSAGSTGIALGNIMLNQISASDGSPAAGCIAPETIVICKDKGYWLGPDGVYEWDGVNPPINITNEKVAPWFKSDTYFNRSQFQNAFARYNAARHQYELHLASLGSPNIDQWVSFNLLTRQWYGPHLTGAFTPNCASGMIDENGLPVSVVGDQAGVIWTANSTLARDGASTAINMDCYGPFHAIDEPDREHHWGLLSMLTRIENGGTLTIRPYVGRLNASASPDISHDLTTGRQLLTRLGDGALCRLRFIENTVNQSATIYGYEIDPVFENGRR